MKIEGKVTHTSTDGVTTFVTVEFDDIGPPAHRSVIDFQTTNDAFAAEFRSARGSGDRAVVEYTPGTPHTILKVMSVAK